MSGKRSLYLPVQQQHSKPQSRRKVLAQGRLTTAQSSSAPHGPKSNTIQNHSLDLNPSTRQVSTSSDHVPRSMDDPAMSPRHAAPHVSVHDSPKRLQPSMSLDLSDTESSNNQHSVPSGGVMMVDASHSSSEGNEVDVSIGMVHSPVKVICHSSSKVFQELRETGSTADKRSIKVDHVPTVVVSSEPTTSKKQLFKPELVVKEHSVVGHPPPSHNELAHQYTAIPLNQTRERPPDPLIKSPGQSQSETKDRHVKLRSTSDSMEVSFGTREDSRVSVQSNASHTTSIDLSKNTSTDSTKEKKKKKVGRIVASRYMQQASSKNSGKHSETAKGPMKATDRSIMTHKSGAHKVSHTSMKSTLASKPGSAMKPPRKTATKPATPAAKSKHRTTPMSKAENKVSTPSADGSLFPDHSIDISAIAHSYKPHGQRQASLFSSPSFEVTADESCLTSKIMSHRSRMSSTVNSTGSTHDKTDTKKEKEQELEKEKRQLDCMYSRYIQWCFLNAHSQRAFKEQEKMVMAQLSSLAEENQRLLQKKSEMEIQLAKLKHMNMLDEKLETQEAGLTPVTTKLKSFKPQHKHLADAIDVTRHRIMTHGVNIPQDQDQYSAELLSALAESEQLLGEITMMTSGSRDSLHTFSQGLTAMQSSVQGEIGELNKCEELLSAAESLSIQARSLKILEVDS